MTIYFNTERDNAPWSDRDSSLGKLTTGPLGLLTVLEARCGTSGTRRSHAARVAGMMGALATSSVHDWFRSSFAADPWGTAAELLSVRDELLAARVAHGPVASADHQPLPGPRLQTLTALTDNPDIPGDGMPDRVMDLLDELRSAEFRSLKPFAGYRIVVDEPRALLPPVWHTLLDAVLAAGGEVEYRGEMAMDTLGAGAGELPALTVVTASDEWHAAEHLAAVLSRLAEDDPAAARNLALVVPGDASALDWTLTRWGLPTTGRGGTSAARWGLQILPAFLATVWRPADPQAIAAFLSLAAGMVPAVVSRELIHALSEHPGTGGPKWTAALGSIAAATDAETADHYDRIFAGELFNPEEGVPAAVLDDRLTWLNRRVAARADERQPLRVTLGHIAELREIVAGLSRNGGNRISRALLERILGTIIHPMGAGGEEEAAPWTVYGSLSTVPADARLLICWNCTDAEPAVAQRFTDPERETLEAAGYLLESPEIARARREWNRRNALSISDRRIVALVPGRIRGGDAEAAPWLAELKQALGPSVTEVDLSCDCRAVEIAGVSVARREAPRTMENDPSSVHHIPPGSIRYPEKLSYSGISSLIGCPMKWSLGSTGVLSAAANVTLPTGTQMIGTMTHAIVERIAREHSPEGVFPDHCGELAASLFDEMVPAMAAELLQPGRNVSRRRYMERVVAAVTALGEVMVRLGLTITRVETFLEAPWSLTLSADGSTTTVRFCGPADMELADGTGNPFVLDLKYSYAENFYTELVSTGAALQLASYAWLIEQETRRKTVGSGYFLLPKTKLITDSALAGDDAVESHRTLPEIWRRCEQSTAETLRRLHFDGVVAVTGLDEAADEDAATRRRQTIEEAGGLYVQPPCRFCDYAVLCGLSRGQI